MVGKVQFGLFWLNHYNCHFSRFERSEKDQNMVFCYFLTIFMSRPVWPCFRGTTLCAAPSKNYASSKNYHACIAMTTWPRCAPPILCWPWPPYNLLPRSCLTWIFFVDPHWWVPLWVQRPAKAIPFQQIIMHTWQCQHDLDGHLLFCVDLGLHIISSRGRV